MARPKKGDQGCEDANSRWRKTMYEKYGGKEGVRKRMSEMGRIGGKRSRNGGFASDVVGADGLSGRERARLAGAKGGRVSRRTGIRNGEGQTHTKEIDNIERTLEALKDSQDGGD